MSSSNDAVALRKPEKLMRLKRLGSMHQSRLSFSRALLRRLAFDDWEFYRQLWDIDDRGVGCAVYTVKKTGEAYSLVVFSHQIDDGARTDRVIANVWDATFVLVSGGKPTNREIERLRRNIPLQEGGRCLSSEISMGRANRSVRLWEHVLKKLSVGEQPDEDQIRKIGYLMRTTAVYGSGKFGCADRRNFNSQNLFSSPFHPEMLSVYLIRVFSIELIEHLAKVKGSESATVLDPRLKKKLGIGNSTGLGMAPFLLNHPGLLNNWMLAREKALADVLAVKWIDSGKLELLKSLVRRSFQNLTEWFSEHAFQKRKLMDLENDLRSIGEKLNFFGPNCRLNLVEFHCWANEHLQLEGQELLISLLLELYPERVDPHATEMFADEEALFPICGDLNLGELKSIVKKNYEWVDAYDFGEPREHQVFWYVSEEKSEPRLGNRFEEDGAELELPLGMAKMVQDLKADLEGLPCEQSLAEFLLNFPRHRHTIRRICINAKLPYSEIRDNLLGGDMLPLDLLRCKLSFLGVDKFDPRSDRWVRISLFQRAPYPEELKDNYDDLWIYADEINSGFAE